MTIAERVLTWFNSLNTILTQCNEKITSKNGTAAATYTALPAAIDTVQSGVDTSAVTATAGDVLQGKKIVDASGTVVTGTMPNQGTKNMTLNGIESNSVTIPKGYHSGSGIVSLDDNIKTEVSSQKTLIQEISSIVDSKASAYPTISYDASTQTLTITEVS